MQRGWSEFCEDWSFSDAKVQHVLNKATAHRDQDALARRPRSKRRHRKSGIAGSAAIDAGTTRPSRDLARLHALGLEHRNPPRAL